MKIEKNIVIHCSPEDVYNFITDIHNVTRWGPIKSVRPVAEDIVRVGAQYVLSFDVMGQQFDATTEVRDMQPHHSFAFKTLDGPLPLESRLTFEPIAEGTNVILVAEGEPSSSLKLLGPVVKSIVKKQVDEQLVTLKKLMENER